MSWILSVGSWGVFGHDQPRLLKEKALSTLGRENGIVKPWFC